MGFNVNNNNPNIGNKLFVGKPKDGNSIDLNKLNGIQTNRYKSLISYIEKTQNIKIDADGNGLIEGNETSIFQNALVNLAGKNGIIDKKDFSQLKDISKYERQYLFGNEVQYLSADTTRSRIESSENGDYQRFNGSNVLTSGKKNGVSFTTETNWSGVTQNFQDGSQIDLDKDGREVAGKTISGESFRTAYIDGAKVRNFMETGLAIFYKGDTEIYRTDRDGERYTYQQNEDGSYQKTYLDKNETRLYNAKNEFVSGRDNYGDYTVTPGENGTYTKEYESGETRTFDGNSQIGGRDANGREYNVKYNDIRYGDDPIYNRKTKQITYNDNNEVYITTLDNRVLEHRTKSYTARYDYQPDGSYQVTSYNPDDRYQGSPRRIQRFDNQKRLIEFIDRTSKDNNFKCTYDENGNRIDKYTTGEVFVYNKDNVLISKNGLMVNTQEQANNARLDGSFSQGDTGDCWLISGLSSIMLKPGGTEFLEKQIKYNDQDDTYTVTLPGAGKKYLITQDEVNNASYLANGDKDVRLFEIAMDRYIKETGNYSLDEHGTALDGNTTEVLYDALFGKMNGKTSVVSNVDVRIFNSKRTAYTVANTGSGTVNGIAPDGKEYTLSNDHGYFAVKSDEKYVYLIDPGATFDPKNPEANLTKVEIPAFQRWCNAIMQGTLS